MDSQPPASGTPERNAEPDKAGADTVAGVIRDKFAEVTDRRNITESLRRAGRFELYVSFLPFGYLIVALFSDVLTGYGLQGITKLPAWAVIYLFFLFAVIFSFLISGLPPLTLLFSVLLQSAGRGSIVIDRNSGVINLGSEGGEVGVDPSKRDIALAFIEYVERSKLTANVAQRRPNVLLFVGTAIAAGGLLFFIYTLPVRSLISQSEQGLSVEYYDILSGMLPRLLMLLFIQVLAGFFLRQYRSSMEEFRYYEALLRQREAQQLSYRIRASLGDQALIGALADTVLVDRTPGAMEPGQTTQALEAQKAEVNEMLGLVNKIADLIPKPAAKGDTAPKP